MTVPGGNREPNSLIVAGPKPTDDPSQADDQAEFARLSERLFGNGSGTRLVGAGTVYAGQSPAAAFKALGIAPDFDYTKPEADTRILFVHRRLADGDLYFVDNRGDREASVDATFRVSGKEPELWRAETGSRAPLSYSVSGGRTTVPLRLEPWGTAFVVFRKDTTADSRTVPGTSETVLATLEGPWAVAFQPGRGAPAGATFPSLTSWSESADTGSRYFSGTGTYTRTVDVPQAWIVKGERLWLDLGDVKNLAEVLVNGKSLGVVWHAPYRVDVTDALSAGANELSVKVTNSWVNRLIGDEQPGTRVKYTFADVEPYKANSPLMASGLLGPGRVSTVGTR